jgi:alpha-1,3-mannosyltransferase
MSAAPVPASAAEPRASAAADRTGRRLRVLHVVRQYHPSTGGLENYVAELVRRQAVLYDVTVLTLDRVFDVEGRLPAREVIDGIPVVRMAFRGRRKLFLPSLDLGFLRSFDLIHVHATDQIVDCLALLGLTGLPPFVLTTHGLFFHTEDLRRVKEIYLRTISRLTLPRAREIFAVSGNDQAILAGVGIASTLLRNPVVPYGDGLAEGRDFLYVGRISPNKRIHLLVDFMAELKRRGEDGRLHVVGGDTEGLWPGIADRIAAAGVGDRVERHGFMAQDELAALALRCGYAVSASRYEGYGLSVVEAMSVGLLPVVQANAAYRETIGLAGCGLLTDFSDPASAVSDFLSWRGDGASPATRRQAVAFARTQSWASLVEVVDASYRRALSH